MNNEPDYQKITSYLLGSLPPAETEIFDELSFTDEDFVETLRAAENDLIDGYLHGELTGETLTKFESFYLASPLRREKVEFAKSLQKIAGQAQIETAAKRESAGFIAWFKNSRLQIAFAFGALMILVLGALFFTVRRNSPEIVTQNSPAPSIQPNNQNRSEIAANPNPNLPQNIEPVNTNKEPVNKTTNTPTPQPTQKPTGAPTASKPVLASFVLTPPLRNTQIASFPISKETTDVAVRLELESNDFPAYRVVLTGEAGNSLRQFAGLRARGNSLNVRFPARSLKPGVYTFEVSGVKDGAAEIISNYTFRVVLR